MKKCSKCDFENPDFMKFCGNCGQALEEEEPFAELREIAIIFGDMVNFTKFSENKTPEQVNDTLNRYWKLLAEIVKKYDCHIDKYLGDGVLVLCGYPRAHENDCERAILITDEFIQGKRGLNYLTKSNIQFRFGIHYGKVYAGAVGGGNYTQDSVMGDTVNTAERIQEKAESDTIYISKDVFNLVKGLFYFEEKGNFNFKGKINKLDLYKFIYKEKTRGKIRGIESLHIPMIGRDRELNGLIDNFNISLKENIPFIELISGEAGIGKSRLLNEFLGTIEQKHKDRILALKGRCLPYGEKFSNWPIMELIRNIFELKESDDFNMIISKIRGYLISEFGDLKIGYIDALDIILHFLGLKEMDMEPKKMRNQLLTIMENILQKIQIKNKLVIIIEDFHWIDISSLEFLKNILKRIRNSSSFVLLITRPEYRERDVLKTFINSLEKERTQTIELKPLKKKDSRKIIELLLEIEKLPSYLKDLIVEHSEGNPFYTEEIIKTLIDKGTLIPKGDHWEATKVIEDVDIPKSVNAVIQARIDALSIEEKKLLQSASVIGYTFDESIIRDIFPKFHKEKLDDLLERNLLERDVEKLAGATNKYKFKHILIQEVTYGSILHKIRRELHNKIASWIEENLKENIASHYNLLAYHFEKAQKIDKAIYYYNASAKLAQENFALAEAESIYKKIIKLAKTTTGIATAFIRNVNTELGNIYSHIGENKKALNYYNEILQNSKDESEKFSLNKSIGEVYQRMANYEKALEYFNNLKKLTGENDLKDQISINISIAWVKYLQGDINKMGEILTDSIKKVNESKDKGKEKINPRIFNLMAIYYSHKGNTKRSTEYYLKAMEHYKKSNDIGGMGVIYNNLAGNYSQMGNYKMSLEAYKKSLDIAEKTGENLSKAISLYNIGEIYGSLFILDKAEEYLNRYIELNKIIDNNLGFGYGYMGLATIFEKKDDLKKAEEYAKRSTDTFHNLGSKDLEDAAKSVLAKIYILENKKSDAKLLIADLEKKWGEDNESILLLKGIFHGESNNFNKSLEYFNKLEKLYDNEENNESLLDTLRYKIIYSNDKKEKAESREKLHSLINEMLVNISDEAIESFINFYKV
ncbi:tetratricopeptide repeat protein [bacterium]|nr:tetratricopeptide repeat protein [bacterium]